MFLWWQIFTVNLQLVLTSFLPSCYLLQMSYVSLKCNFGKWSLSFPQVLHEVISTESEEWRDASNMTPISMPKENTLKELHKPFIWRGKWAVLEGTRIEKKITKIRLDFIMHGVWAEFFSGFFFGRWGRVGYFKSCIMPILGNIRVYLLSGLETIFYGTVEEGARKRLFKILLLWGM